MGGIIMTLQLLLALSLLVVIHEFGHYIVARMFGIRVTKFYVFFNPKISILRFKRVNGKFQFKFFAKNLSDIEPEIDFRGNPVKDLEGNIIYRKVDIESLPDNDWRKYPDNTEYGIGWLPLGGYVKIAGMIDESLDVAQMKEEPKNCEFRSKPAWQRFLVMIAGVLMNVIAGVLIFTFSHMAFTKEYLPVENVPEGIYAYQHARDMNLKSGDKIIAIDGKSTERYEDILSSTNLLFAKTITVERNGMDINVKTGGEIYSIIKGDERFISLENFSFTIDSVLSGKPADIAGIKKGGKILFIDGDWITTFGALREKLSNNKNKTLEFIVDYSGACDTFMVNIDTLGLIGISPTTPKYESEQYNFFSAMKYGWKDAFETIHANIKGFGLIFSGKEKASESLSGPIGIARVFGGVWQWERFWKLTGLLSMILAFVNILPIPALDGGHALFSLIEAVMRRKLSDKFMEVAQIIGMVILLGLMVFVIGNDLIKLF
jgi:regulator of sigma E protease